MTKQCKKTTSGKHVFRYYNECFNNMHIEFGIHDKNAYGKCEIFFKCIACDTIDDKKKKV